MSTAAHKPEPRRRRAPGLFTATLIVLAGVALVGSQYGLAVLRDIRATLPPTPVVSAVPVSTAVVDKAGLLLRPFTTANGRWRLPVTIAEVDRRFIDMLLAYEDQHFNEHQGIDWPSMLRAAVQYAGAGRIVSGGSTLTMQVARLIGGEPTRNIAGKLRQMVHADMLERSLSKDDILTLYLTLAPYGGNIQGIRAASLAYFGKEPRQLSAAEAATLVALPQSPERRRPDRAPALAQAARDRVLIRGLEHGVIDRPQFERAASRPAPDRRLALPMQAPHLATWLAAQSPGTVVPTTVRYELHGEAREGRVDKGGAGRRLAHGGDDDARGAVPVEHRGQRAGLAPLVEIDRPFRRVGGGGVDMVGRDDRHRLDAVGAAGLGPCHLGEGAVGAASVEAELGGGSPRALRIGGQGSGYQRELAIEPGGDAVHRADEGALPAANHAEADATARGFFLAAFDGHGDCSFPCRSGDAEDAAVGDVVGSGTGAKNGEWLTGSGFPSAL